ncbi:MAG: glutaredoxin [Lentisphaeraceae bacterium]|nr:glutaredoxin [Lentisphaeraceae bacterium]
MKSEIYRRQNCPWGEKAVKLLNEKGIDFKDHIFSSKEEEEKFKESHGVKTTPQIFLEGKRIGGYTDLAKHFDEKIEENGKSYKPVIAIFATAGLLALASKAGMSGFMGYALCLLSCLKLMDLNAFVKSFKKYDLFTKKVTAYGYLYPFAEMAIGLGFLSGLLPLPTGILSIIVGLAGGISIIKAVYVDKTDLNCACVGGNSNVPLGIISFSENAMMAGMGVWVLMQSL